MMKLFLHSEIFIAYLYLREEGIHNDKRISEHLIIQFISNMKAHGPNHQHDPKTKAIFEFLPGPVKIKDGLFMGD